MAISGTAASSLPGLPGTAPGGGSAERRVCLEDTKKDSSAASGASSRSGANGGGGGHDPVSALDGEKLQQQSAVNRTG
jgi:hypothetical protein